MATTKEIVDQWVAANPDATAAQVAAAVQSAGGLTPEIANALAANYGTTPTVIAQEFIKQLAPQQLERAPDTNVMNYFGMDPESGSGAMETVKGAVQDSSVTELIPGELYRSSEPITIDGKQSYGLYDKNGTLFRIEADPSEGVRLDGGTAYSYWDPDGTPHTTFKADGTGLFGSGIGPDVSWVDVRDNLEAAAVVGGNYFLPGSSLLTSQLVTEGAQENLNTDAGRLINAAAGFTGGLQGNMANYGRIGEATGLTSPTVTPTGAEGGAVTGATTGSTTGGTMLDYSMPTAQGGLGLQGTAALDGTLSSGLAAPAGGSLGGGLGLTASAAGNLGYMGGAQGLTANAIGGGTLSSGGVNTGLFTPDNLFNSSIGTGGTGGTGGGAGTKITASDVIKTLPLVNTVATLVGGADTGGGGPTGTTGFSIVPIPESWKPPTYIQSTQAPIDLNKLFTDQNLLIGTQWEGLPNQRNLTFNDIFAAGQQKTPMGTPVNINNLVSAILGQNATS